jgi:GAF domain-containing protein
MVVDDGFLFCADVERDPPPGWRVHPHVYRTFLAVPVRAADHAVGMLTVDSLTVGDLDSDRDTPVLRVLARILAISQLGSAADGATRISGNRLPDRGIV